MNLNRKFKGNIQILIIIAKVSMYFIVLSYILWVELIQSIKLPYTFYLLQKTPFRRLWMFKPINNYRKGQVLANGGRGTKTEGPPV